MNELAQYQTKIKAKMRDVYGKDISRLNTTHMDLSHKYEVRVLEKALKEHKKFHDQLFGIGIYDCHFDIPCGLGRHYPHATCQKDFDPCCVASSCYPRACLCDIGVVYNTCECSQ